jgi:hypothetical protein
MRAETIAAMHAAAMKNILHDAIRDLVVETRKMHGCIRATFEATRLAAAYPSSGLSIPEIAEVIAREAVHAGVAVELGQPDRSPAAPLTRSFDGRSAAHRAAKQGTSGGG